MTASTVGCKLMLRLDATQSLMSRHRQVLKQAGLVVKRLDAQWVRYRLNLEIEPGLRQVLEAVLAAAPEPRRNAA